MVVILNNASFRPVKMHAQFQGCWHQKKLVRDPIVSQLSKCLNFVTFRAVILYRMQSFLSPRIDLNFRHLLSCDTIEPYAWLLLTVMKKSRIYNF